MNTTAIDKVRECDNDIRYLVGVVVPRKNSGEPAYDTCYNIIMESAGILERMRIIHDRRRLEGTT